MMRLLYVIDSLAPGGAEMSLLEMAPRLIDRGLDLHVLALGARLDLKPRLEAVGVVVHEGPINKSRVQFVRRVAQVLVHVQPTLVHTTLYEADIAGRIAARLQGVRSSTSLVGDTYGQLPRTKGAAAKLEAARVLDRLTARFGARFHAVSEHLSRSAQSNLGLSEAKIEVIPRGRDGQRFQFRPPGVRERVRNELGLPSVIPVVIAVGRLEPVKGLTHLMEAMEQLTLTVPGVQLLVAGKEGSAGASIRSSAAKSGASVRFLGHRQDVERLLAAADVLAFPSLSEGSPGTLIEAMATGCPVVASDIEPNIEVLGVDPGGSGLTVPVGDAVAMAHALRGVLKREIDVDAMTARARRRFQEHFEIGPVTERMATFFEEACFG